MPVGIALAARYIAKNKRAGSGASLSTARSPSSRCRLRKPHPTSMASGLTAISGFPKATSIASRAFTPDGRVSEFGAGMTPGSRPLSIVVRDGALCKSARRLPRRPHDARRRRHRISIPAADSQPRAMALHPDGSIWFVETGANALGRIARDGSIAEFAIPTPNASARGVTVGADGDLWFTENFANKIGRMNENGVMIAEYDTPTHKRRPLHCSNTERPAIFHAI